MAIKRVRLSVLPLLPAFPGSGFRTQSGFQGDALGTGAACMNPGMWCDRVGSHLSGSLGDTQAVTWMLERMKGCGLQNVHTEKIPGPHGPGASTWE